MKFSIALATVATILSVTSAVPVALERRGAAALNKRALLTRDDHDVGYSCLCDKILTK